MKKVWHLEQLQKVGVQENGSRSLAAEAVFCWSKFIKLMTKFRNEPGEPAPRSLIIN